MTAGVGAPGWRRPACRTHPPRVEAGGGENIHPAAIEAAPIDAPAVLGDVGARAGRNRGAILANGKPFFGHDPLDLVLTHGRIPGAPGEAAQSVPKQRSPASPRPGTM